ncbi:MAG: response regulator transcription factor [Chitinophagaceae bacterium]|nr:response regulator transcription factor [Chitinophagaceae bacterium]
MAKSTKKILVGIADDHSLLRNALANLINTFDNYTILFQADNGKDLRNRILMHQVPEIVLLDVNMPEMDGFETTQWLHKNYPHIKVLALSMLSDEKTIIRMFRLGAKGYLLKKCRTRRTERSTRFADGEKCVRIRLCFRKTGKRSSGC